MPQLVFQTVITKTILNLASAMSNVVRISVNAKWKRYFPKY